MARKKSPVTAPSRREVVFQVAAELVGTCQSLENALTCHGLKFEDLTQEDCALLDDNALQCDGCGWWCEPEEMYNDSECTDCHETDDNDEGDE